MQKKEKSLTRRDFIRGTLGASLSASLLGSTWLKSSEKAESFSRVTLIRDKNAMDASNKVNPEILKAMLDQTLIKFTNQKTTKDAWLSLVKPEDIIGLVPTTHLNATHREVVDAVKSSLIDAGIPENRIMNAQGGPDKPKACTALICPACSQSSLADRNRDGHENLYSLLRESK